MSMVTTTLVAVPDGHGQMEPGLPRRRAAVCAALLTNLDVYQLALISSRKRSRSPIHRTSNKRAARRLDGLDEALVSWTL